MQATENIEKKAKPRSVGHIEGLDGLRGIAVIGVILYHLFPDIIKGGFLGVSLFFVLSGYLIAVTSRNSLDYNKFNIFTFYKKRLKRIYPSLVIVVFATIGALKILAPNVINGIKEEIISIFLGYNNFWQVSQNSSYFTRIANASPFTHLWSLSIELQFYLVWPLFFLLYKIINQSKAKKCCGYVFLIPAIISIIMLEIMFRPNQDVTSIYYSTVTRVFSLFLGAFLGVQEKRKELSDISSKRKKVSIFYFVVLMVCLVASYLLIDGQANMTYRVGLILTTILFCEILKLAVNPKLPLGKWLNFKPLAWLGEKSYEIYLWQYPVIFVFQYLKLDRYPGSPLAIFVIVLILATWVHEVQKLLFGKNRFRTEKLKLIKKFEYFVLIIFFVFTVSFGAYSSITAPDTKKESQEQLQEELRKNLEVLSQQKTHDIRQQEKHALSEQKNEEFVAQQKLEVNKHKDQEISEQQPQQGQQQPEVSQQPTQQASGQQQQPTSQQPTQEGNKPGVTGTNSESDISMDFVTAIGDSVMLGAAPQILKVMPNCYVDAKESRQVIQAGKIISSLSAGGNLGNTVVIALGTNGPFSLAAGQSIIDQLGKDKVIFWVTAYGKTLKWQDDSNSVIHQLANNNANVFIIDWATLAPSHPEWFYYDGIHLKVEGQKGYANMILDSITKYNKNANKKELPY